jgi:hypothetical protein
MSNRRRQSVIFLFAESVCQRIGEKIAQDTSNTLKFPTVVKKMVIGDETRV